MQKAIYILTMIIFSSCLFGCATQFTFDEAKNSYHDGQYGRSFKLVEQLARTGDLRSQYALGYLYYYGFGAPRDEILGIAWITKAANGGNAQAKVALARVNEAHTAGVTPEPIAITG